MKALKNDALEEVLATGLAELLGADLGAARREAATAKLELRWHGGRHSKLSTALDTPALA
ncbi:hypothetical protein AWB76_06779 [Caballeronia temeraria]|uniref:Uncharacterized protein n=1 Tax=Caballeronia temeraria TaxID=1777137 RepID=A0A158DD71_9BURK|nr:hypothetical protein [Caballeronia temeraria]SAK92196.1 hypothetical protein AWB76_06779 [Caballeronia temeraria]